MCTVKVDLEFYELTLCNRKIIANRTCITQKQGLESASNLPSISPGPEPNQTAA